MPSSSRFREFHGWRGEFKGLACPEIQIVRLTRSASVGLTNRGRRQAVRQCDLHGDGRSRVERGFARIAITDDIELRLFPEFRQRHHTVPLGHAVSVRGRAECDCVNAARYRMTGQLEIVQLMDRLLGNWNCRFAVLVAVIPGREPTRWAFCVVADHPVLDVK